MHRDLHLGNVLHNGDDFLLADFGSAKTTLDLKVGWWVTLRGDCWDSGLGQRVSGSAVRVRGRG